jgi:hypothetical protein
MRLRVGSRTATTVIVALASLALSVALAVLLDFFLLFLVVPFVPFLFADDTDADETEVRQCPVCGFRTRDEDHLYCPRDGEELRRYHE